MCIFEDIKQSNLVVIAGVPNSGRTTFSLTLAEKIEYREGLKGIDIFKPRLIYSTILSKLELEKMYLSNTLNLPIHEHFSGNLSDLKTRIKHNLIQYYENWMIYTKNIRGDWKLDDKAIVVLDMFHFLDEPLLPNENETVRISKIITELRKIAQELNLIIICTSEINMDSVRKKRKDLLCLRDSIKIGSVADIVFLIDYAYSLPTENNSEVCEDFKKALNLKNRIGCRQNIYFDKTSVLSENQSNFSHLSKNNCFQSTSLKPI